MPDELGTLVAKLACDLTDLKQGLLEGKAQLGGFQTMVEGVGAKVRQALSFAGISFGLYEITAGLKRFGDSILEEGGKTELLRGSVEALGSYYGMSAASIDIYVEKLKAAGITEQNALMAISGFEKAGISIAKLPDVAEAAKAMGASVKMGLQESFNLAVESIVKGTPRQLRLMLPGIVEVLASMGAQVRALLDSPFVSGTEKSEIMLNASLAMAEKMKGAITSVDQSYFTQINNYKAKLAEVKEALFALAKPIGMAITGEEIKSWDDFYSAVGKNKEGLKAFGETVAGYIRDIGSGIREVVAFAAAHGALLKTLLEMAILAKVGSWIMGLGTAAFSAIPRIMAATGAVTGLQLACTGPWSIIITVGLVGFAMAFKNLYDLTSQYEKLRDAQAKVGHGPVSRPGETVEIPKVEGIGARGQVSPELMASIEKEQGAAENEPSAKEQADRMAAQRKAEEQAAMGQKAAKGGAGKSLEEQVLEAHMQMLQAKRAADLAAAEDEINTQKATLDNEKSLLEKSLAEGLIDGQTYYQRLQQFQQQETAAALALVQKKKQAQIQAYQDELAVLSKEEIDPAIAAEKSQALAQKNRMELAKLDAEAARIKLEGEKKVTDELTRQMNIRREYEQKTGELNVETASLLGAISQQEATLQKLTIDWAKAKADAIKAAGSSPADQAALHAYLMAGQGNLEAQKMQAQWGPLSTSITQGMQELLDNLTKGGQDLKQQANKIFSNLFNTGIKPGLDSLQALLVQGFNSLFKDVGSGVGSAIMGMIGLVGALLTSAKSSFSPSGKSSISTHEATRGVISGDTTIPVERLTNSLETALEPTNDLLAQMLSVLQSAGLRGGGASGGTAINIYAISYNTLAQWLDTYFQNYLQKMGA